MKDEKIEKKLRVAILGHKRIPGRESGVEIVVEQLSRRLAAQGVDVVVMNRRKKGMKKLEQWEGVRLVNIPTIDSKSLDAPIYALLASIRACLGHFDVIHYHAEGSCIMLWLCHLMKKRTVVTIHGLDWQRAKWGGLATKVLMWGEKCAAKYADSMIVLSRNMQKYFAEKYHRETIYIPNGVEPACLCTSQCIARQYDLAGRRYLLFVGRIVPEKGLDYLVDAYKSLETELPLIIAGGSSHTTDYETSIKAKASDDPRIRFVGHVEGEQLRFLFSNAYIYILPSEMEGMPVSLLEAMSYGNCCLTSDIPENSEVILDCGETFHSGDVENLRLHLIELLSHDELVRQYKQRALERSRDFSWDKVFEKTVEVYRQVLK